MTTTQQPSKDVSVHLQSTKALTKELSELTANAPATNREQHKKALRIFFVILLAILLLTIFRIPYVGCYQDAYIFEFAFGDAKYLVYVWLLCLLITKIFDLRLSRFLLSSRCVVSLVIIVISAILIITSIVMFSNTNKDLTLEGYFTDFTNWANTSSFSEYTNKFFPALGNWLVGLDCGIIGAIIVTTEHYVTAIILIILGLLLIITAITILTARKNNVVSAAIRKWVIHLLGGNLNDDGSGIDELLPQKADVKPEVHNDAEIKTEATKIDSNTPPISFLTNTSLDHYYDNKSKADKYQTTLLKFIQSLNLEASYKSTTIMPQFSEISFEIDGQSAVDEILKKQSELLDRLKIDTINISFKGNVISFEIPNDDPSKISIRQILDSYQKYDANTMVVGLKFNNDPLIVSLNKNPNSLIIGKHGSGSAMLLSTMIMSLAYLNNPKNLSFVILNPLNDKVLTHFNKLKHMDSPVISDLDDILRMIIKINDDIAERERKFKELGASNIDEYNKFQTIEGARLKKIVLVISSFDKIIKTSLQCVDILNNISTEGAKHGIYLLLSSNEVNTETIESKVYEDVDNKFILKLASDNESLRIFNNYRAAQLYGNGDGYYVYNNTKTRFQSCYFNLNELSNVMEIINTFYSFKEQQI